MPKCPKHHITLHCPACAGEKFGAQGARKANENMTAEQRQERARKAALHRWADKGGAK